MAKILIGTSGYYYRHWKGVFYPPDLQSRQWLRYYSNFFDCIELNVTFYRLPKREIFAKWNEETGPNFTFILKGPRTITHYKKLKNVEESLMEFFKIIEPLGEKIKVILWQFPPNFTFNPSLFADFCRQLKQKTVKFTFEFRHLSWFNHEVYTQLKNLNAAMVQCDWPFYIYEREFFESNNNLIKIKIPSTADFAYVRRHGATAKYASDYSKQQLAKDAVSIKQYVGSGHDVFEFFNNDAAGYAIKNALELKEILNQ